jgi:hypothetical protein
MKKEIVWHMLKVFTLVAVLAVCPISAIGQGSTATITGVVHDASGAVVPNASVEATQTATNYTAKAVSGSNGVFSFPSLPVGQYSVKVDAQGFAPYEQTGIVLNVGQVANLQIPLKVGGITEKITVEANASAVEPTESTIKNVLPEEVVSELPLNGRNPATLIFTVPGVTDAGMNMGGPTKNGALNTVTGAGNKLPSSVASTTHGVQSGGTYFALDGASNMDPYAILGGPFPNPDATQEFNVVTGTYGARYASAPGGAVSIVTKSGTNVIHGSLFEYLRNGKVNAQNAILQQPDSLKRNQYGGAIGAPIIKDRWFIFGSYQGTRQSQAGARTTRVPTQDERNGLFTTPFGTTVQIPSFLLSPTIQNFLEYIPLPNRPNGFYVIGVPSKNSSEQFAIKSDFNIGSHRLFGRYFYDHGTNLGRPMQGKNFLTSGGEGHTNWDSFAAGDTWASGQWIAESRVSFSKVGLDSLGDPALGKISIASLGAKNFTASACGGIPIMDWGSVVAGGGCGNSTPRNTWDVSEDVSLLKNNHQLSFGFNFRKLHFKQNNTSGQGGVMIFPGVTSLIMFGPLQSQSIADLVLGSPLIFIQGDGFFNSSNGKLYGFYVEDKYRATSRLTLTAGLRWDPYLPYTAEANQINCWIPGEKSSVFTNAPTGLVYPGDAGCPVGGTERKLNNFQPRIGLAYDLTGNGKTSIRAGYGIYSMQLGLQTFQGFSAPPWVRQYVTAQPFLKVDDIWTSAHMTDPFIGGFNSAGFSPAKDAVYPSAPYSIGSISKDFKPGYVQQWTLSIQRAITESDMVEIAYVGTKGTHITSAYDLNLPANGVRPLSALSQIRQLRNDANSSYNGLEISFNRRMKEGLFANSSFSWSKCIDEGSAPASTGGINAIEGLSRRALCDFDQNYVWRTTATWEMPKFKNANSFVRGVFGNWTTSGLLAVDAGQTFSITDLSDPAKTGTSTASGDPIDVADRVPGVPVYVNGRLNYAAFTYAAAGTHGNSGRNAYRGPGYRNIDMSLMKNFPVTERLGVSFKAEAFNIFNHPNYYPPVATLGDASFGTYTVVRDPRILQFSLRIAF